MEHTIAHYTVHADRLAEHEALLADLFSAFDREGPGGLRYSTAKLDDGLSFVHFAQAENFDGLTSFPAFRAFRAGLEDRCDGGLSVTPAAMVGSFGGRA